MILIYRIGNLGDIVCSIPAMVAVRRHYSNAWIGLLTNKEQEGNPDPEKILEGNDFLDEIITYETKRIREPSYLYNLFKKIHLLRVDLLVYFSISDGTNKRLIRDWLFFRLAGCKKLLGFKMPKPQKIIFKNGIKISVFPQETDRLMQLLYPLGINTKQVEFKLPIRNEHIAEVDKIWSKYNLSDIKPIVAISPAGKFSVNHWNVRNYAQVSFKLQKEFGAKIILIGGTNERIDGEQIVEKAENSIINLIGKTNFMESAEVLSRCDLLVSNDCGSVHLAAAVGTPVVGIYSSRNFPRAWHPWGENHTILRNDSVPCRFCFRTECESMECINSIAADQVVEACRRYLEI